METTTDACPVFVCGTPFEAELRAGTMSAADLADVAHEFGAAGVEHRTIYWRDRNSDLAAAAQRLRRFDLSCTYASFAMLYDPDSRGELERGLNEAVALGSPLLRVFAGAGPVGAAARRAAEAAVEAARNCGVMLAVENYVRAPGNTMDEIVAAIDPLDPEVVGVNVDVGNYAKNGQDPLRCLQALLPRVIYCHFKDISDVDGAPQVTPPGTGRLDLGAVLATLISTGRHIPLGFEYAGDKSPKAAISTGLNFVRAAVTA